MSKNITILGAGESGTGSAILAKKQGYEVFVSDSGKILSKYKDQLIKYNIEFEEDRHSMDRIVRADEVVKSPGIPDHVEIIREVRLKNIPVISEIEFAGRFTGSYKICITGSNGKKPQRATNSKQA